MPQETRSAAQPPLGVVYNTSMERPDAALALAELYGFEGKRESRMGAVCVTGAGLNTAIFCDIVARFYSAGPPRNSNQVLAVGLAAVDPLPPDPPMVEGRARAQETEWRAAIRAHHPQMTDTALAEAVLRNGVIFNAEARRDPERAGDVAGQIARPAGSGALQGARQAPGDRRFRRRRTGCGRAAQDRVGVADAESLLRQEVGDAARSRRAVDKEFAWAPAHPVVDAYRAFKPMPYDAPSHDLAAIHYAVHPDPASSRSPSPARSRSPTTAA